MHATNIRTQQDNNAIELWLLRMAVCNAIVDPWLYIVLRRESLRRMILFYRNCRGITGPLTMGQREVDETDALLP